jgi:hypothetical protein
MSLSVVYWNVAKCLKAIPIALEAHREYNIIAIQEPVTDKRTGRLYCPSKGKYHLIYSGKGRAALYIHCHYDITGWSQATRKDWCRVTFRTGLEAVTVWSIYSPCEEPDWQSPLQELPERLPEGRHLIVSDLNLHHPLWDREGRTSSHTDMLLSLGHRWNLRLATP